MTVSVHRLVQRGAARNTVRDRIALEDALNTTLPQDGRLVLVRKLRVRGSVASPQKRHNVVGRGWAEAVSGAVHATSSFAASANCVWFASRTEAEAMLLRRLLAGQPVVGWFWALAIPDWRGLALEAWLPRRVARCLQERDYPSLARIAASCIDAGEVGAFVEAAEKALRLVPAGALRKRQVACLPAPVGGVSVLMTASSEEAVLVALGELGPQVLSAGWTELLTLIERANGSSADRRDLVRIIVQEQLRRASPALALDPGLWRTVAERLLDIAANRSALALPELGTSHRDVISTTDTAAEPLRGARAAATALPAVREQPSPKPEAAHHDRTEMPPRPVEASTISLDSPHELASRHAGLWLVVPPLIRLGFREWLGAQCELLGKDPGRHLVLAIALRHRVPRTDPALAMLETRENHQSAPQWTETWRLGLDRWLRRNVRRRTHDLVARAGWIASGDDRLDIFFPLAAADLRLRRLALDSDPGWTDWLGMTVRFHFTEAGRP